MESMPYCWRMVGFTKRQPIVVSKISACARENAVSAFGMTKGARLMLSTPPATPQSMAPVWIARAT